MPAEFASFAFISTLAAVINGLGIIRWLNSLADYLRKRDSMTIEYYWVYTLAAVFQFVLHILLWWATKMLPACSSYSGMAVDVDCMVTIIGWL